MKNKFLENKFFFYVCQCHEKRIRKYFLVFDYTMKNKLENNLLMFYF